MEPVVEDSAHGGAKSIKQEDDPVKFKGYTGGVDAENVTKDAFVPSPSFRTDIGQGKDSNSGFSCHCIRGF